MTKQDFKFQFILIFLFLFLIWFISSFFAIPYEDGTNTTFIPALSYKIAKFILFSFDFWYTFFNSFFAFLFTLLFTSLLVTFFIYGILQIKRILNKST